MAENKSAKTPLVAADERVQLTVRDFVVTVGGLEDAVGTPTYWAEWPTKELPPPIGPVVEQQQMQPCAGRNCGSTNPNLHSAECFEDYEKSTGMNQWQGLTDEEISAVDWKPNETLHDYARHIELKLRGKNT